MLGGTGIDTLLGQDGTDFLYGEQGDDNLIGGTGDDRVEGGDDNDTLQGEVIGDPSLPGGKDVLDGGAGADLLVGGGGDDILIGGAGNDRMYSDDSTFPGYLPPYGNDWLDGGEGDDYLEGGDGDDDLYGGDGIDVLFGDRTAANPNPIGGNDLLEGGAGDDQLYGDGGTDELLGGDGADQLTGGTGDDTLEGGAGNDIYVFNVEDGHDVITDTALPGEGNVLFFNDPLITLPALTLTQNTAQHTLTIQVGAAIGTITLEDFDLNNVDGTLVVQTLNFSGIGPVALASLLPLPEGLVHGTTADDVIHTGTGDDVVQAFAGNDFMDARDLHFPSPLAGEGEGEGEAAYGTLEGVAGAAVEYTTLRKAA